jgi:stage V sporulation protein B
MSGVAGTIAGRDINVLVPFAAAVLTGVVVYVVMAIALRAITLEDMKLFPKGEKIAKILHIHD